jgi:hypothetical protein
LTYPGATSFYLIGSEGVGIYLSLENYRARIEPLIADLERAINDESALRPVELKEVGF